MAETKPLLFRKWDTSQIEIKDLGLQQRVSGDKTLSSISLKPV
ncbi:MAG: 30S ribosomal protein S7, partial [Candidatus Nitrosopelagicus sp.]